MNKTDATYRINSKGELCVSDGVLRSILVMDDDETILNVASQMLGYIGYNVTTCVNGEEAIELYKHSIESGTPYLAIILGLKVDVGMGGLEAARHIIAIDPNAKLIISSGYSDDQVMADHKSYGFHVSLPKPYGLSYLSKVLASLN